MTIVFFWPGKTADEDAQRVKCDASALLQGVFRDLRGSYLGELFYPRVVALVLHAFYRARIEAAARLEAAYEWRAYPPEPLK